MALRDVNLVPARFVYRRRVVHRACFWSICLLMALFMIAGIFVYQTLVVRAQRPVLQSLDEIQLLLGERRSSLKRIRAELQRLNQQRAALAKITQNQSYCQVLWKLTEIFIDETWLTQLSIDRSREKDTGIQLGLTGLSTSNATLGNLMSRISIDPMFKDVRLVYAKEGNRQITSAGSGKPLKLIQFQIESLVTYQ